MLQHVSFKPGILLCMTTPTFHTIPANQRFYMEEGWLKTFWLFSFGHYRDPENMNHGVLRVFNDDIIAGNSGFEMHPHRFAEIVTIVRSGAVTHKDSAGNEGLVGGGEIQRMYAGHGVLHSEKNEDEKELDLYQLWFLPKTLDAPVSYEQKQMDLKPNVLTHSAGENHSFRLNAKADIYLGNGDVSETFTSERSNVLIYVKEGSLTVDDHKLSAGDQLRISDASVGSTFNLESKQSDFIIITADDPEN